MFWMVIAYLTQFLGLNEFTKNKKLLQSLELFYLFTYIFLQSLPSRHDRLHNLLALLCNTLNIGTVLFLVFHGTFIRGTVGLVLLTVFSTIFGGRKNWMGIIFNCYTNFISKILRQLKGHHKIFGRVNWIYNEKIYSGFVTCCVRDSPLFPFYNSYLGSRNIILQVVLSPA